MDAHTKYKKFLLFLFSFKMLVFMMLASVDTIGITENFIFLVSIYDFWLNWMKFIGLTSRAVWFFDPLASGYNLNIVSSGSRKNLRKQPFSKGAHSNIQ